jgi:malate dehydrogenase (oxaloacetate-decarboxylating)(NADP+)
VYPDLLIQFEDWSSEHAFGLLEKYQSKLVCFNDDIQGTGSVILSGVMNAIRKVQKEDGVAPEDHRIVFYGAGSAAIGVARQIQDYFQSEFNMTEDQAKRIFWIVDSKVRFDIIQLVYCLPCTYIIYPGSCYTESWR